MRNAIEIAQEACQSVMAISGRTDVICSSSKGSDYDVCVCFGNISFAGIVSGSITAANFASVMNKIHVLENKVDIPLLLISAYITPAHITKFVEQGINVIDSVGNCSIRYNDFFILISGRKPSVIERERRTKTLSETSIRLVYHLLSDKTLIHQTYRAMCEVTGISLGSVKNAIEDLTIRKFIATSGRDRKLINREELIELWQQRYNEMVKPKSLLKRVAFKNDDARSKWKTVSLPKGMLWGGDCGANLIDGYLVPGEYEIYTSVPAAMLLATGKFQLSENGEVRVYRKWWDDAAGESSVQAVPPLIIYADLMGSGDSRCVEAAQRILPML